MTGRDDVPPERQCTLPTCTRAAVDTDRDGQLCERHLEKLDEDVSLPDESPSENPSDGIDNETETREGAGATTPEDGADAVTSDDNSCNRGVCGTPYAHASDEPAYPDAITRREWWVAWILDGVERKRPVAPWQTSHAYPVEWRADLDDGERPEVDVETAKRWVDFPLADLGLVLPDDAQSDTLRLGIILPVDRPPRDERIVLIDWDDVRDPATGEIHPIADEFIDKHGGYVEVSRSGEGLHQFVFGGLRHRDKFIAPIDTDAFVGDDLPQVEIYDGGRHVAMTGEHVDGTDTDVVDGQDCIDAIVSEFATAELDAGHRTYDPATGATPTDDETSDASGVDSPVPEPEPCDYQGPPIEELREQCPPDRSLAYHAVVEAFCDGYAGVLNWRLEGAAAALGQREDRTDEEVVDDLRGAGRDGGSVGYDKKTPGRVTYDHKRAARGEYAPASYETLASWGVLPGEFVDQMAGDDVEHVAILPETPRERAASNVWDWQAAAADDADTDPLTAARDRTQSVLEHALDTYDERVLVEALPTLGKSSGTIRAAAATDEPISVLTGRGHKEQYEQFEQWCDEQGLTHKTLPAFTHDCPTARGDHGDDWQERVLDWYRRGATPQDIHKYAEQELGRPLPCQVTEDGQPHDCEYAHKWDFDPDSDGEEGERIDVLIGHYAHAHKPKVSEGRTIVFDEFPASAYETELGGRLQGAVTQFLQRHDALPYSDYTDLIERRRDDADRADALAWFLDEDALRRDPDEVFAGQAGHAAAPIATFALLAGDDLGNGWEHTNVSSADVDDLENASAVYNREQGTLRLLDSPALEYTRGVVGLDGTPTLRMWRRALGAPRLHHRPVLSESERREYIQDGLDLQLVPTTDAVKPYNNPDYVSIEQDAALLEAIQDDHGEAPGLITSSTALHEYDASDAVNADALTDGTAYHGNVLGSNEFGSKRVGAIIGSTHYGDGFIKKWAAYDGEPVERNDEKGAELSYGDVGDEILTHMREHQTLQAAMRFGRDGNGAAVYIHTNTLPDWVPTAGEGRVLSTWSDGLRQVIDALADLGAATTSEIAAHPGVDVGKRQVFDHLETLRSDLGVLERHQDTDDGRRVVWRDGGIARLNEHGDVEFEGVSLDDLGADEVRELARSSLYTWEFMNFGGDSDDSPAGRDALDVATDGGVSIGGDPPPR